MSARQSMLGIGLMLTMLVGCTAPQSLPASNTTPIPTLIPVTEVPGLVMGTLTPSPLSVDLPAQKPSAEAGQLIYGQECTKCHGDDGKGAVPGARDFTDVDFVRGESPATFFAMVSQGHGQMLAFKNRLSVEDRWNTVFYVWGFSTSSQALAQGKDIFAANCAACHGADGKGLVLGAADFTNMSVMATRAPRDLYQTVTQGKGSMPAWQGRLSQSERWAVIDFIRMFTYDPISATEAGATQPVP